MEHKILECCDGRYYVDVGITVEEWKTMLLNNEIFYPEAKDMVMHWYYEEDHQATSKTIMIQYAPDLKNSPYNGIVKGLSTRIMKYLNRFWVENSDQNGKKSYWCIPFEGWYQDYDEAKNFVWKLRDELVQAIDLILEENTAFERTEEKSFDELTSIIIEPSIEGKRRLVYTTKYERSRKNRDAAIRVRKKRNIELCCEVCGFDFEKVYGERGRGFIEVHHNKPLYTLEGECVIDPEKDLNCLCSNCHRMIHRDKTNILTVDELKKLISINKI
ncbi:MAG: HNH endonuclease [Clostridia bacterium]|nr:HNH endonuclease [Clostridia bacterium]